MLSLTDTFRVEELCNSDNNDDWKVVAEVYGINTRTHHGEPVWWNILDGRQLGSDVIRSMCFDANALRCHDQLNFLSYSHVWEYDVRVLTTLLELGLDANNRDRNGRSYLEWCSYQHGFLETDLPWATILIDWGCSFDVDQNQGLGRRIRDYGLRSRERKQSCRNAVATLLHILKPRYGRDVALLVAHEVWATRRGRKEWSPAETSSF